MNKSQLDKIIDNASFIICGYAFSRQDDGNISIVCLVSPYHAAIIEESGTVLETNMHDIELDIVLNKYWRKNKKLLLDPRYA